MVNILLVYSSNQPYEFDKIVYIRDPVFGPRICQSSALKTLGPDIPQNGSDIGTGWACFPAGLLAMASVLCS